MPFECYLRPESDDRIAASDHAHPSYEDASQAAMLGIDSSTFSGSIQFQMPQFMMGGPPSLAPGGGAEVLLPGLINTPGSMASAWLANSGFGHRLFEES
jgi:hypothetical protein